MRPIFTLALCFYFAGANAQDGTLDNSFGTSGLASHSVAPTPTSEALGDIQKILVLPDGKILQCFTFKNGSAIDFGIARFTVDGALDLTFDTDGFVTIDFSGGDDFATSMVIQKSDGKIVVGGYSITTGGTKVFAVARLSSDGALDNSFSGDGRQIATIGTDAFAYSINIQPGGKIVQAGYSLTSSGTPNFDFTLVRYDNTNGNLDNTFDTDGIVVTDINSGRDDAAYSLVITSDGRMVAAGFHNDGSRKVFAIARYNSTNGALDNTFSSDGKHTVSIGSSDAEAYNVTLQLDGKIVVGGYANNGLDNDLALIRLTTAGATDNTFDGDGIVITDIGGLNDVVYSVAIQTDGKILVGGTTYNGADNDFVVARYTSGGVLDVSGASPFNGGLGSIVIDFSGDDFGYSIASQGNNLIVAGVTGVSLGLARLLNSQRIVPVKLRAFTATRQNTTVALNWETVNEYSMLGYEIERSADGINFTSIGTVEASGKTSSSYTFPDRRPLPGINFYRLKMINADLSYTYSRIVTVRFNNDQVIIQAFPNPVTSNLNVQFTLPEGEVMLQLFDAQGRSVKQMQFRSTGSSISTSIDMSNLKKGIYFIRLNEETLKIIKD